MAQVSDLFGDFVLSVFRHASGDPVGPVFRRFGGHFGGAFGDFFGPRGKGAVRVHSRAIAHFSRVARGRLGYLFPSIFLRDPLGPLWHLGPPSWRTFRTMSF